MRGDDAIFPPASSQPLTANETALIKSIFGEKFKTANIRKIYAPLTKFATRPGYVVPATTFGENIKFYGPTYNEADYSQTQNLYNFGTFLHEMVHVWQNSRGLRQKFHRALRPSHDYTYELTRKSHFRDFGEEQQASIIEDYARQFLFMNREVSNARTETYIPSSTPQPYTADAPRSLYLLQKVVEDKFPEARRTRLRRELARHTRPPQAPPAPGI